MSNIKLKLSCYLIGLAIKTLPKEWQTDNAIKNLVSTGAIETLTGKNIHDKV